MKWVSVDDGMPDEDVSVLIAITGEAVAIGSYQMIHDESWPWWHYENGESVSPMSVSHWMPLPEPPA